LAQAVRDAGKNVGPILEGSLTVSVPDRNRNRRKGLTVHDTDLTVTRIDSSNGAPLAVLVNWTAHPTFMNEDDMLFSGDWPGHMQRTIESSHRPWSHGAVLQRRGRRPITGSAGGCRRKMGTSRALRQGNGHRSVAILGESQPHEVKKFGYHTEILPCPSGNGIRSS